MNQNWTRYILLQKTEAKLKIICKLIGQRSGLNSNEIMKCNEIVMNIMNKCKNNAKFFTSEKNKMVRYCMRDTQFDNSIRCGFKLWKADLDTCLEEHNGLNGAFQFCASMKQKGN